MDKIKKPSIQKMKSVKPSDKAKSRNRRSLFSKAYDKTTIGFIKDEGSSPFFMAQGDSTKPVYKYLDFKNFADHVAFRIAHFMNETRKGADGGFENFLSFMRASGVDVLVQDVTRSGKTRPQMVYAPVNAFGYAMSEDQISPMSGKSHLEDYFGHKIEFSDFILDSLNPHVIPLENEEISPTWSYTPHKADESRRDKAIAAAGSPEGLHSAFPPSEVGTGACADDMLIGTKLVSRRIVNGRWEDEPYSKTFTETQAGSGVFEKQTNSSASFYRMTQIAHSTLDGFLDDIYDGGFTFHGQSIFPDKSFVGKRIQKTKEVNYALNPKEGDDSQYRKLRLPSFIASEFERNFPDDAATGEEIIFRSLNLPNVVPARRKVFAIDLDGLDVPEDFSIFDNQDDAIAHIRRHLPPSLSDTRMIVMLSSSYGMSPASEGGYRFDEKISKLSCRLWFESEEYLDPKDFGDLVVGTCDAADPQIYVPIQPIYGDPNFPNAEDPLKGRRRIVVEGQPAIKADRFYEDLEHIREKEKLERDALLAQSSVNLSSEPGQTLRFDIDGDLIGLERSRAVVHEKLSLLGNRVAMKEIAGMSNHFHYFRNIINAHLYKVYDDFPDTPPISMTDLHATRREDVLMEEINFLSAAISQMTVQAVTDETRYTSHKHLDDYGIFPKGLDPQGKIAVMLYDASQQVAQDTRNKFQHLRQRILKSAAENTPLPQDIYQAYVSQFTYPTSVDSQIHQLKAESFTGVEVLTNDQGILINDRDIGSISHKIATFDGTDKFFWFPQEIQSASLETPSKSKPNLFQPAELKDVLEISRDSKSVTCPVLCHNYTFSEIRNQLPQPETRFGSKDTDIDKIKTPIRPLGVKKIPKISLDKDPISKLQRSKTKRAPDTDRAKPIKIKKPKLPRL